MVNHFWNTFDQVLLRPSLFPYFDPASLLVLDRVADHPILRVDGVGGVLSDHLPIVIKLAIERELDRG